MLYELCTVMYAREKCASARVQVGVVCTLSVALTADWLSAKLRFSNFCLEIMQ